MGFFGGWVGTMAPWLSSSLEGLCAIKCMNNCGSQLAIKSQKGKWNDDITEYGVQRHLYSWLCEVKEVGLIFV